MTSFDRFVLIFVLAIALTLNESRKVIGIRHEDGIFSKHRVYVGNDLGEGLTLNLHCASEDDDLGMQVLPYGQNYNWGFRAVGDPMGIRIVMGGGLRPWSGFLRVVRHIKEVVRGAGGVGGAGIATGKHLWGHIDGTDCAPNPDKSKDPVSFIDGTDCAPNPDKSKDPVSSPSWAVLDARIMSWRLGSVEPHIVTNLRPHRTAQSMWTYLKRVYHQDNDARRFQLEHAIATFQHDTLSIQDYYSGFLTLWNEYADLVTANVPVAALSIIQKLHKTSHRDQFLMKLCPNLNLIGHYGLCYPKTRTTCEFYKLAVFFYCKEYGHIATNCPKKYFSYCKKKGHIIKECRICPQHRQAQAFQTSVIVPSATPGSSFDDSSIPAPPTTNYYTPEMVQQMLISALSVMGFQGNTSTNLWYMDSGASNDMMNTPTALCHVRPYASQSAIQTANGSSLPIATVGDASSRFTNVFLAPQLSTNLISVGQLVDNNCAVHFSGDGCVVQDQQISDTRRSRPQSLSVARLIFDPTTLQIQPGTTPPALLVHRSPRVSVPPDRYGFPSSNSSNSISALTTALSNFDIPTCYSHAAKHDFWRQAMQEEITALEVNHTWDIEQCPPTIVPLGCKWVYSVKV
ncbi:hypothetical protein HHK36_020387 [Tetracentron sinense]|uniref:CCHC-type domain-containing protein n=1 Tax=Tetracentron sinense TaxID=13715 RepID=A0A834YV23_TETSI|nr:hypothetical protein HHK36_020387 [Tetracentron sinense]